jgi:hypothetical protein
VDFVAKQDLNYGQEFHLEPSPREVVMQRSLVLSRPLASIVVLATVLLSISSARSSPSWNVVTSPNPSQDCDLRAIQCVSANEAWAVGSYITSDSFENRTLILHMVNGAWSVTPSPNPGASCSSGNAQWGGNVLNALAVVSPSNVWAVGYDCYSSQPVIEHWNGTAWSLVPNPVTGPGEHTLSGIAAVSASDIWAVGYTGETIGAGPFVVHWNGTQWSVVSAPRIGDGARLNALAAIATNDVWGVGAYYEPNDSHWESMIQHWNGTQWSVVPSPSPGTYGNELSGLAVVSANDIWAIGRQSSGGAIIPLIEHWDGQHWTVVPSPNIDGGSDGVAMLCSIAAIAPNDVWAAGVYHNEQTDIHQRRTLLEHWDGTSWTIVSSPSPGESAELHAIAASPSGVAYAVGMYSDYPVQIYDGTYTVPQTLVLANGGQVTAVDTGAGSGIPTLGLPSPNPATRRVSFSLQLPSRAEVTLGIFDVRGRRVRSLLAGNAEAGPHEAIWDGLDSRGARCGAGVYFARLTVAGQVVASRSIALLGTARE